MKVSIYHISEIFLYEYYINKFDYEISDEDLALKHINEAVLEEQKGNIDLALQEYINAHLENPVRYDIYNNIIRCCRQLNDLEGMYNYTLESHKFCCTRAELASFYRNLGYYYLEKYNPQLSLDLYRYSKLFYENENADHEIEFLKEAMKDSIKDNDLDSIQYSLNSQNIPVMADRITLALLYKAGEEAATEGAINQAIDCYKMVYDLTYDDDVKGIINNLTNKLEE
ncbi:MAG: hypothetical protein K6A23_02265 [Butyrivibrio sp.]|nr:hypothetical protein [Butyrivibrio sp.]